MRYEIRTIGEHYRGDGTRDLLVFYIWSIDGSLVDLVELGLNPNTDGGRTSGIWGTEAQCEKKLLQLIAKGEG